MELWILLTIIGGSLFLLTLILLVVVFNKRKTKNIVYEYPELIEALGTRENILSVSFKGSRVNVEIKDKKLVNKDQLKQGVVETVVVSSKKVTMVVGNEESERISNYLNQTLVINE
jgi:phosphotransferase system IIB component